MVKHSNNYNIKSKIDSLRKDRIKFLRKKLLLKKKIKERYMLKKSIKYMDETKKWIREVRFNKKNKPEKIESYSSEFLSSQKKGDRSELLFRMHFNKIFPGMDLYYSSNKHAPFCDALIKDVKNPEIPIVVEIKTSLSPCVVPMNENAYRAMIHGLCPNDGKIISVLYTDNTFAEKIYVCRMNQMPTFIRRLDDGRVLCKLVAERIVNV